MNVEIPTSEIIKQTLIETGITQQDVAERLKVSLKTVSNKLNSRSKMYVSELIEINDLIKERTK